LTTPPESQLEKTEVLYGVENAIDKGVQFMKNTKKWMDLFGDKNGPSIIIEFPEIYKNNYIECKRRGGRIRLITEITRDNIRYCKELMKIVHELRHLEGFTGGIAVSESEYMTTTTLREKQLLTQVFYSNAKEVVDQGQYIFNTFWKKAIPAEQKIREIEEGIQPVRTTILEDQDEIIEELRRLNKSSTRLSVCSAFGGMQMGYKYLFDSYLNIIDKDRKGEGKGMRWVINIDKENLNLVKVFLNAGILVRHIKHMPPMNFGVSDKELAATIEKLEGGKMGQTFLISNEPLYINHFNSLFDEIWKNGIDADLRIKAIEEGVDSQGIEIIQDPVEMQELASGLVQTATQEILIIYSTANAFHREEYAGGFQLLKEAISERGVKVRILTPVDELIEDTARTLLMVQQEGQKPSEKIGIRYIEPHSQTKLNILIVDRKFSLAVELKDDAKQASFEAIGLITYSDSKSTVLSYASIFESLWNQTELYQKLKEADKIKDDFIHVAAHELRTPIQPILGLADILRSKQADGRQQSDYLDVIIRNAKRLQRLTEDILEIARIDGKSLHLKKELFNLSEMIRNAITDSNNQVAKENKDTKLKLEFIDSKEDIDIEADKSRINQVILNLLGNAIKFTNAGTVTVAAVTNNYEVLVSITDTGTGIDSEIISRLFTKFATKSTTGTGLGLFISKSIVEAHGGKIWAKNNYPEGKGAKFAFSLPLHIQNVEA
jgi:two-component system, OmpR family, sensor histidine kinase VicK